MEWLTIWPLYGAAFSLALAGGPHCLGMCGGIHFAQQNKVGWQVWLAHAGRLTSYMGLGALFGGLGGWATQWHSEGMVLTQAVYLFANGLVVLYGLSLLGLWRALTRQRRLTHWIEAGVGPLIARVTTHIDARYGLFLKGVLWGLIPCGLTYNALLLTPATQSGWAGAALMAVFGATTLISFSVAGGVLRWVRQKPAAQQVIGAAMIVMGGLGLYHALAHGEHVNHAEHSGHLMHEATTTGASATAHPH